jgi:hypothetical protein
MRHPRCAKAEHTLEKHISSYKGIGNKGHENIGFFFAVESIDKLIYVSCISHVNNLTC